MTAAGCPCGTKVIIWWVSLLELTNVSRPFVQLNKLLARRHCVQSTGGLWDCFDVLVLSGGMPWLVAGFVHICKS